MIITSIYKWDPLSTVSLAFQELQSLLGTCRHDYESYRHYEARFAALLANFNALGPSINLSK